MVCVVGLQDSEDSTAHTPRADDSGNGLHFAFAFLQRGKPNHHIPYHAMHSILFRTVSVHITKIRTAFPNNIHKQTYYARYAEFKVKTSRKWYY
jgi:hypothetical protein